MNVSNFCSHSTADSNDNYEFSNKTRQFLKTSNPPIEFEELTQKMINHFAKTKDPIALKNSYTNLLSRVTEFAKKTCETQVYSNLEIIEPPLRNFIESDKFQTLRQTCDTIIKDKIDQRVQAFKQDLETDCKNTKKFNEDFLLELAIIITQVKYSSKVMSCLDEIYKISESFYFLEQESQEQFISTPIAKLCKLYSMEFGKDLENRHYY